MTTYHFMPIDVSGASKSDARGINDLGTIVGSYAGSSGASHGFTDTGGRISTYDAPGARDTSLNGINILGERIGNSFSPPSYPEGERTGYGFTLSGDHQAIIGSASGFNDIPAGINDLGTIVGHVESQGRGIPVSDFVLDRTGKVTSISPPGVAPYATYPTGINDHGQIVGYYERFENIGNNTYTNVVHGFVDNNGTFTDIAVPGGTNVRPSGINNLGQIVGTYTDKSGKDEGFIDTNGTVTTIRAPGATETAVNGINDLGQIVGQEDGHQAFVATPACLSFDLGHLLGGWMPGFRRS